MNCATKYCLNDTAPNSKLCHKCRSRKWRKQNPLRAAFITLKSNAKKRNCIVELTFEEFSWFCKQTNYIERKGLESDSLTIDRVKESVRIYRLDNIQVLTRKQNVDKFRRFKKKYKGWMNSEPTVKDNSVPF
jgi:hypothetical protein